MVVNTSSKNKQYRNLKKSRILMKKINLNVPAFREENKQSIGVTVFEKTKRSVLE